MKIKAIITLLLCVIIGAVTFSIYKTKLGENSMAEVAEVEISSDTLYSTLINEINESPELEDTREREKGLHELANAMTMSQEDEEKQRFLLQAPNVLQETYKQKADFIERWKAGMVTEAPEAEKVAALALREMKQLALATELDFNLKVHFTPQETLDGLTQAQANLEAQEAALRALATSFQEMQQDNPEDPALVGLREEVLQAQISFVNQGAFYMEQVQKLEQSRIREWHEKVLERGEDETNINVVIQACEERIASRRMH